MCDHAFRGTNARERHQEEWQSHWDAHHSGRDFHAIEPTVSLKQSRKFSNIARSLLGPLIGLRVQNSHLNSDLHRCQLIPSPRCDCGRIETIHHYLIQCPLQAAHRTALRAAFSRAGIPFTPTDILRHGFTDDPTASPLKAELIRFIRATKRFSG